MRWRSAVASTAIFRDPNGNAVHEVRAGQGRPCPPRPDGELFVMVIVGQQVA
jgi:hypothetical protein